jgi:ABC-2 type transport system permease protein
MATTVVVLIVVALVFGLEGTRWLLFVSAMVLSALAFSAMGALISVAVTEVFEAQTLANAFRFPMMFLGGVFVPLAALPRGLQVVARVLPLTYAVEAMNVAMGGGSWALAAIDLMVLAAFSAVFLTLASRVLARRLD